MGLVRRSQDTLTHWGIPGQKWGVRRWQYPDGRFTEEGKERYFGKNAESEGYVTKNKDGSYTMTEKGYNNTDKILEKLNIVGSTMTKNRNWVDKYNDMIGSTLYNNPIVYEYIGAAKKALQNSNYMGEKMYNIQKQLYYTGQKYADNDSKITERVSAMTPKMVYRLN